MAEVVYQNLEDMLPELEDLEHQGVFTQDELRTIIKRRTDFEYKLQKRVISKQDIISYIEYELKLNQLRLKRCKRMKLKPNSMSAFSITKKIHSLFRKALMKFSDDLELWKQYIEFCRVVGSTVAISKAFGKLLQQHSHNPGVWLMAAKYEFEMDNNVTNARSILLRGLRNNKDSKKLWHEYFRLELLHVDKIKQRKKLLGLDGIELKNEKESEPEKVDEFLQNKTAEIVFKRAIETIKDDVGFRIRFFEISQVFKDTKELSELILDSMKNDFPENEEYITLICSLPINELLRCTDRIIQDNEWLSKENESITFFQQHLQNRKNDYIWEQYVKIFFQLLKQSKIIEQAERRLKILLKIFETAQELDCITESMYLLWSELFDSLQGHTKQIQCLEKALMKFPTSVTIWKKYLFVKAMHSDSWEEIEEEFKKCFKKIQNVDIWKMLIDFSTNLSTSEQERILKETISTPLRRNFYSQYLQFLIVNKAKEDVRYFYKTLQLEKLEASFLLECIQFEKSLTHIDGNAVQCLYEKLIDDYGSESSLYSCARPGYVTVV